MTSLSLRVFVICMHSGLLKAMLTQLLMHIVTRTMKVSVGRRWTLRLTARDAAVIGRYKDDPHVHRCLPAMISRSVCSVY